jgi:hypothetical protein
MDGPLLLQPVSIALLQDATHIQTEKDACIVPRHLWESWIDRQTTEVLLVEILQRNTRHILCVESYHTQRRDLLYLPSQLSMEFDMDEYVEVNVLKEMPPLATRITLEPLEADSYGFDIAGATSEYLSHWNILKSGTTLTVPSLEIEGYTIMIHVAKTEPADIVLLRGEVPMELVELPQNQHSQQTARPSTPIPALPSPLLPQPTEDFDMLPSLPTQVFAPFGGKGYRLGS